MSIFFKYLESPPGIWSFLSSHIGRIFRFRIIFSLFWGVNLYFFSFYTMCAQLKALLDRTVAIFPRLTDKKYYYIMTMADTSREMLKGTVEALRGFLDCYEGSVEAGMICGLGVYEKGEVREQPVWEEAYRAGLQI